MIPDNEYKKIKDYIHRHCPEHIGGLNKGWLEFRYIDEFNGGCHIFSDYNTPKERLLGTVLY